MDKQYRKIKIIEWLANVEEELLLTKIEKLMPHPDIDELGHQFKPMSVDEFMKSIERAEDDILKGNTYSQEEVETKIRNW